MIFLLLLLPTDSKSAWQHDSPEYTRLSHHARHSGRWVQNTRVLIIVSVQRCVSSVAGLSLCEVTEGIDGVVESVEQDWQIGSQLGDADKMPQEHHLLCKVHAAVEATRLAARVTTPRVIGCTGATKA